MSEPQPEVHLAIGSRFENIELVKVVLDDCLRQLELDEDAMHWIELAVREAVANAIKHGNRQDPEKRVDVDLAIEGDAVVIRIEDQGTGFDPSAVHDPLAPENRFKRDGRGIFYMKKFMDSIEYGFRPEGGTVLTLRKRLGKRPTAGPSDQIKEEGT